MTRILADKKLFKLSDFLPEEVDLIFFDPNVETPDMEGFDALLIRSVTKIQRNEFNKIPLSLKFIGTGSSGRDHVDENLLQENNIHFVDAKGTNANVVAEYVATSLITLSEEDENLLKARIGIIGVGAVGKKVNELLKNLDYETVLFDPPREKRDPKFKSVSLKEILDCEILTFHMPLHRKGIYSTYHWLDSSKLKDRKYLAIINTSRGGIIDENAVLISKLAGNIKFLISDVWENEPDLNSEFVSVCDIATPHIAGSSVQSKMNASKILALKICDFFELGSPKEVHHSKQEVYIPNQKMGTEDIILKLHPIIKYDSMLREIISKTEKESLFGKLRTDFPLRNEYSEITISNLDIYKYPILKKLGISN